MRTATVAAILVVVALAAANTNAIRLFTVKRCATDRCEQCEEHTYGQNECFPGDSNYPSVAIECGPDLITQLNWENSTDCTGSPITFQIQNGGRCQHIGRKGDPRPYQQVLCPDPDDFLLDVCASETCGSCTARRLKIGNCHTFDDRSVIFSCVDENTIVQRHFSQKQCTGDSFDVFVDADRCTKSLLFPGYTEKARCPKVHN